MAKNKKMEIQDVLKEENKMLRDGLDEAIKKMSALSMRERIATQRMDALEDSVKGFKQSLEDRDEYLRVLREQFAIELNNQELLVTELTLKLDEAMVEADLKDHEIEVWKERSSHARKEFLRLQKVLLEESVEERGNELQYNCAHCGSTLYKCATCNLMQCDCPPSDHSCKDKQ